MLRHLPVAHLESSGVAYLSKLIGRRIQRYDFLPYTASVCTAIAHLYDNR
ncbi:hypothetical protein NKDENANG_03237 [Candidatus Entotheonellaceae bacterium PAL068K]